MSRTTLRVGGAFGLSHVVVVIAGFALTGPTDTTPRAPIQEVLAFYTGDQLMQAFTGGYIELVGYLLFVPFLVCLGQHLRRHEGRDGIGALSAVGLGAVYLAAIIGTGFGAGAAAMWTGTHAEAPAGVVALNSLRSFSYAASLAAFGAFLVAVAVSALIGRSLPKWLSVSALVIGATLVAGIARFVDGWADIVAFLGLAWIIAVSVWGLRSRHVDASPYPDGGACGTIAGMRTGVRVGAIWTAAAVAAGAAWSAAFVARASATAEAGARFFDAIVLTLVVTVGGLVLSSHRSHGVGRILLAGGTLWSVASLPLEVAVAWVQDQPGSTPAGTLLAVSFAVRGFGWTLLVAALPLLFPDGRLPSPRWRTALRLAIAGAALHGVSVALGSAPPDLRVARYSNALALPASLQLLLDLLRIAALLLILGCAAAGVAAIVRRWRRGDALTRQRIGLFAVAGAVQLALIPLLFVVLLTAGSAVVYTAIAAVLPVAIAVGVAQRRLYDLPRLLNRTLVYLVLSGLVIAMYVLVVAGVGAALNATGGGWLPLLATGVVAAAILPLREAVQRGVNRLTYGAWEEPYAVVTALGRQLADVGGPGGGLPNAIAGMAEALRLPYVAVLGSDDLLAEHGRPTGAETEVPLVHEGVEVGRLVVGLVGTRRARDSQLIHDLARQVAPAAHAAALTTELRRSRDRLVLAREEERRRLRRDLHDGLGPVLAAAALKVDTARNVLRDDPRAEPLLLDARAVVQGAVGDVRRVVDGLRPPALDELGLAGAVARLASDLSGPADVRLEADCLQAGDGRLPAAVEVAAYRIVQEALTNVVRHSGASTAVVRLHEHTDALHVEVADDGCGLRVSDASGQGAVRRDQARGTGMDSMRERAEEVGGTIRVSSCPDGGTVVAAALPTAAT